MKVKVMDYTSNCDADITYLTVERHRVCVCVTACLCVCMCVFRLWRWCIQVGPSHL